MDQLLEEVKANVQQKFSEIRAALHMREKLLLRQLEVIANTQREQSAPVYIEYDNENKNEKCEVRFVTGDNEEEEKLLTAIRSFGQFQLDSNMQLALHRLQDDRTAGLRNEDYIEPVDDHETMYKCLEDRVDSSNYFNLNDEVQPEAIVVDFSRNKALLEDNAKRSIINITLQEAKDLIRRAKIKRETFVPPLNLEELDDELESSIADAVSSLGRSCPDQPSGKQKPKTRKPRFKPKITINNCNGTINLRNISSLTINCASEDAVSADLPLTDGAAAAAAAAHTNLHQTLSADSSSTATELSSCTPTSSNYSSNASSRSQSKKHKGAKRTDVKEEPFKAKKEPHSESVESTPTQPTSTDTNEVTCDFYNRLLNEIKKSLKQKPTRTYEAAQQEAAAAAAAAATVTSSDAVQPTTVAADSSCEEQSRGDGPVHVSSTQGSEASKTTLSSQLQPGKRLVLKNFENLKIILEANSGDEESFHPVQIEQWLAEIISETDLEPMQNTDILEHSKIHSTESN
ncbi:PREDICTED: uncharacterized protein LOC108614566 isoform X2 [Drosophila arizonae]|uniref:Uncharacterized protein LOC108614566 isoform X1 n=1 Tax=Drosophila arizonae TaxID=7263 RepID=A0ABM1PAJ4_DROAR|nr:PREDICTED: uncharacterized protein LOC108614566 isoform X1 [Drosophila arizonae]XP_017864230.1 PREDICTED: uncharacterized protein LOC108614566 isoform X2 [Drosophila arizonae]